MHAGEPGKEIGRYTPLATNPSSANRNNRVLPESVLQVHVHIEQEK